MQQKLCLNVRSVQSSVCVNGKAMTSHGAYISSSILNLLSNGGDPHPIVPHYVRSGKRTDCAARNACK